MNSFFSSIGPNLAARIPAQKHFSIFLLKQKHASSFNPETPIEIQLMTIMI